MGFQFARQETYQRHRNKRTKKQTARALVNEVERRPGACEHVLRDYGRVLEPEILSGMTPAEAVDLAEHYHETCTDKIGRKVRKDAPIILAGILSHPTPCSETSRNDEELQFWLDKCLIFLDEEYGDRLKSVVLHMDEGHPHIHFYAVPEPTEDGVFTIEDVNPALKAQNAIPPKDPETGETNKAKRNAAYKAEMSAWQDRVFEKVSIDCGHTRIGPKRQRLDRSEWNAQKAAARAQATMIREAAARSEAIITEAEETASSSIEKASAEASVITSEAETKADTTVTRAEQKAAEIEREASSIKVMAKEEYDKTMVEIQRQLEETKAENERLVKATKSQITKLTKDAKIKGYEDGIAESKTAKLSTFAEKAMFGFNRVKRLITDKDTWEKRAKTYRKKYREESASLENKLETLGKREKKIRDLEWDLEQFKEATGAATPDLAEQRIANLENKLQRVLDAARSRGIEVETKLEF